MRSEASAPGKATAKQRGGEHQLSPASSPLQFLRRCARRFELLLRALEQFLLGRKARALNRLAQLDPLDVVDFAELRLELTSGVHHQIEVHPFSDERVAGAKEVLDRVQWLHDVGLET